MTGQQGGMLMKIKILEMVSLWSVDRYAIKISLMTQQIPEALTENVLNVMASLRGTAAI